MPRGNYIKNYSRQDGLKHSSFRVDSSKKIVFDKGLTGKSTGFVCLETDFL